MTVTVKGRVYATAGEFQLYEDIVEYARGKVTEYDNKSRGNRMVDAILGWSIVGIGIATGIIGLGTGLPSWIAGSLGVATTGIGAIATQGSFKNYKIYARGKRKIERELQNFSDGDGDYKDKNNKEKRTLLKERVWNIVDTVEGDL